MYSFIPYIDKGLEEYKRNKTMSNIMPFKAVYYNIKKVKDMTKVVSPPHDVISADEQDRLHNLSP